MKIVTQALKSQLTQETTFNLVGACTLGSIAPLLVMVGAPAGAFKFGLYDMSDAPLFEQTFDCDDIKTALNTLNAHAYVYYPFIPQIKIKSGTYKMKLAAVSGYTYAANSFLGWGQQHENVQVETSYVPSADDRRPLTYRVKILTQGIS